MKIKQVLYYLEKIAERTELTTPDLVLDFLLKTYLTEKKWWFSKDKEKVQTAMKMRGAERINYFCSFYNNQLDQLTDSEGDFAAALSAFLLYFPQYGNGQKVAEELIGQLQWQIREELKGSLQFSSYLESGACIALGELAACCSNAEKESIVELLNEAGQIYPSDHINGQTHRKFDITFITCRYRAFCKMMPILPEHAKPAIINDIVQTLEWSIIPLYYVSIAHATMCIDVLPQVVDYLPVYVCVAEHYYPLYLDENGQPSWVEDDALYQSEQKIIEMMLNALRCKHREIRVKAAEAFGKMVKRILEKDRESIITALLAQHVVADEDVVMRDTISFALSRIIAELPEGDHPLKQRVGAAGIVFSEAIPQPVVLVNAQLPAVPLTADDQLSKIREIMRNIKVIDGESCSILAVIFNTSPSPLAKVYAFISIMRLMQKNKYQPSVSSISLKLEEYIEPDIDALVAGLEGERFVVEEKAAANDENDGEGVPSNSDVVAAGLLPVMNFVSSVSRSQQPNVRGPAEQVDASLAMQ